MFSDHISPVTMEWPSFLLVKYLFRFLDLVPLDLDSYLDLVIFVYIIIY